MNRYKGLLLLLLLMPFFGLAQKKSLTHKDYDQWKNLSSTKISDDGNYVWYQINPNKGDGSLFLFDVKNEDTIRFNRGFKASLTFNQSHLVFLVKPEYKLSRKAKLKELSKNEQPKNHLVVYNLLTKEADTIKNVKGYKVPLEYSGVIAIELADFKVKEKKDTSAVKEVKPAKKAKSNKNKVLVYQLENNTIDTLLNVNSYAFAETSADLYFTRFHKKNDSINGVYHLLNSIESVVDTSGNGFEKLSVNKNGKRAAWLSTKDSAKAEVKKYALNISENLEKAQSIDTANVFMPMGYMASEVYQPVFSDDGSRLFLKIREIPEKEKKDSTQLKSEKVSLDIWSWNDTIIQPAQIKNAKKDKTKGYLAVWLFEENKMTVLESKSLGRVSFDRKNTTSWLAAVDNRKMALSSTWDYPAAVDLTIIDSRTGEKIIIDSQVKGYGSVSPNGKYYTWYDKQEKKWKTFDIENKSTSVLNTFKEPVWNVDHDQPSLPNAYGKAGWLKNDKALLLYDEYDVWKVEPGMSPQKITDGRKDDLVFRVYKLDQEKRYLGDTLLLKSFSKKTKKTGFYSLRLDADEMVQELEESPFSYSRISKAKDANSLIFTRGNFNDYPDLYFSDTRFQSAIKLSNTNPEIENYNWGNAELIEYKAKKFGKQNAIIYKPENFDPNKKYPVIIYFYERYSDLLYRHFGFSPSRSTVNFAYFTSNGYVVMVPDIVYKDGEPGQSAYNCVVSAAKWLQKQDYVDDEKIGIQGQSWGGYQVAYLVTQTNMFACGMAGAPVSNMTSAYGGIRWGSGWSRMFQYEKTQSRLGATLWEDRDAYIKNSPVFFADKVETPLLIMHNDGDGAVPWYQGIEYVMALRRLNKPAWMLVYNNEEHNLTKWHNRVDLSIRMSQFFDHYLKGAPAPKWMEEGRKALDKDLENGLQLID